MNFNRVRIRISTQRDRYTLLENVIDSRDGLQGFPTSIDATRDRLLHHFPENLSPRSRLYFDLPASKSVSGGGGNLDLRNPLRNPFRVASPLPPLRDTVTKPPIGRKRSCFVNEASESLEKINSNPERYTNIIFFEIRIIEK